MCPNWSLHFIFMYASLLVPLWLFSYGLVGVAAELGQDTKWDVVYDPATPEPLLVDHSMTIQVNFSQWNGDHLKADAVWVDFIVEDPDLAKIFYEKTDLIHSENVQKLSFNLTGEFLGYTKVCPVITTVESGTGENTTFTGDCLDIRIIRKARTIDLAFTYSVAILACIIYINMGAALDVPTVKKTIKRPIGPVIGFLCQFVGMPLLAYGIGKLLLPLPALQLGLFITGCSPGGGASNIWTLTLGGNLDLSITMTTISTFSSFVMMPLWMLTLGSTLFDDANITVPFAKIGEFSLALVAPLVLGVLIQRFLPKVATWLVKIMKPFAVFLILFIVVFAIYTNLYLFEIFTWQILVAGLLLPCLGYLIGGGAALIMKQDWNDAIAIAIETGVQNTGLSIFGLRFSMEQPAADLTTALPVAVAMMTPIIPTLLLIIKKSRERWFSGDKTAESKSSNETRPDTF